MYKFKIGQDAEVVKIRQPLSILSANSVYGQSALSLLGRDHIFSQYVDKNSNMMFIPSNIKITKTKLYSGNLRVDYNNTFYNKSGLKKEYFFNVDFSTGNVSVNAFKRTSENTESIPLNNFQGAEDLTGSIANYLKKLTSEQFASFAAQAQSNAAVVQSLSAMNIPAVNLPQIQSQNGNILLRSRTYSITDIGGMSEGFSKAVNFYNSRKMDYLYVQTKLNIHPAKIEVVNNAGKSVTYRSPTIIIIEYEKDFTTRIEQQISASTLLQARQMAAGVNVNAGYRKKKYQRSTLPDEVVRAIKTLQTRIFMLCPKTQQLQQLIDKQASSYNDLILYYDQLSKRPISSTWTQQVHDDYCTKLRGELAMCMQGNGGSDFTLDEYPIAKVPHFEFIDKIHILDLFDQQNYPTGQDFTIRRKAILYKNLMTPLLDRFKVIANGKLSVVVINGKAKAELISKNFDASQVMIFNGKRRKAIQSIVGQTDMTRLVFENPMLQIPFQMMSVLDVDLYAFRTCMASSISSLGEYSQRFTGMVGITGQIEPQIPYELHQSSIFSWINTLFARRSLRNTEYEGLRIRFNRLIFSNKISGRLQAKLNSIFYNITRFKKVSEKIGSYEGTVDIDMLKFSYNPGKFLNVLFLLYPAVHQLYLGDGSTQLAQAQVAIRKIINAMQTMNPNEGLIDIMTTYGTILNADLAYLQVVRARNVDEALASLNALLGTMQKDTIMSTLAQRLVSNSNVQSSLVNQQYGGDFNKVILLRSKLIQYYLQRFISEFVEFLETIVIIIHFFAEKKFKGISDTNIHSLIVYFSSLSIAFLNVRIAEYNQLDAIIPPGVGTRKVEIGLTGMDVQVFLSQLVRVFSQIMHYIPRPRAHKSKYTKYLIFDPEINAQASQITSYVFDAQKWTMLNTGNIIKELLKDNGRINDIKVNIWTDGQFVPQNLQFSRLLQKVAPATAIVPSVMSVIDSSMRSSVIEEEQVRQIEEQLGLQFDPDQEEMENERRAEAQIYDDVQRVNLANSDMRSQLGEVARREIAAKIKDKKKKNAAAARDATPMVFKDKKERRFNS